jgi:hypothetical protein
MTSTPSANATWSSSATMLRLPRSQTVRHQIGRGHRLDGDDVGAVVGQEHAGHRSGDT